MSVYRADHCLLFQTQLCFWEGSSMLHLLAEVDGQCLWSSFGGFSYPESCDLPGCACASWRLVLARFYYTGWHLNRCWPGPDMVGWDFHRQCAERTAMGEVYCFTAQAWLDTHSHIHKNCNYCVQFSQHPWSLCVCERERWIKSICSGPEICLCSLLCSWHILLFWDYII